MKIRILLLGFLTSFTFCFGQKKGETVTTNWLKHPCYTGVEYKVINYNYKNNDGEASWGIIIRNGYGAPLSCAYSLKVGGVSWASGYDNTYELAPGKTYSHSDGGLVTAMNFKSSSTNFTFEVKDVKVGETKFDCENGRQINLTQKEKNENYQQNQYQTTSELVERKNKLCSELGQLVKGQANNVYPLCQAQTYGSGDVNKLKHEVKLLEDEIHRLSNKGITNQTTTNSNNQSQNQQNQTVTNSSSNTIQNNQIIIEPDKSYEMTKQVFDIASNYVSSLQAQAERERQADIAMENKELAKLDIESDFNEINSPEDYEKVSLTSINYKNLIKILNIEVKKICATALSDPNKAKDKIKISTKIESAFLGGNTVNVRVFDIGRKFDVGKCAIEIFGIVQTNKILNFEEIQKVLIAGKYQILNVYKFKKNDDEFSKEKFTKDIEIIDINKNGNFIEITANTKNTKNDKFRLINFNKNQFVLFYQEKDKLFNYIIKLN